MKREPTAAMKKMYEDKKHDTLNRIRNAIRSMKEWDEPVTKSRIMEISGVSSGTLSKPYVLDLLKQERVCQFAEPSEESAVQNYYKRNYSSLAKEYKALKGEMEKRNMQIAAIKNQKDRLERELKSSKEINARLRGQRQMLLERLDSLGISIGNIKLIKDE